MTNSRLQLSFKNVPVNNELLLSIGASDPGVWSLIGSSTNDGLQITSSRSADTIGVRRVFINTKRIFVEAGTDDGEVSVLIYVSSSASSLGGEAVFPQGASCTVQSGIDQVNIIQSGTWSVRLT